MLQYYQESGTVRWRDAKNCPPASLLMASPYDLEARYSEKWGRHWRGYKVHLTETCDDEAPSLMTHVETTIAPEPEVTVVETLHHGLAAQALLPTVHVVDGAYVSSDGLVGSHQDYQVTLTGPMRQDSSWQAHDPQAFDASQFLIDFPIGGFSPPEGRLARGFKPPVIGYNNHNRIIPF